MTAAAPALDVAAQAYLTELSERLQGALGDLLVGAWLIGSGARDDYQPASSDLDVVAAVTRSLTDEEKARVVAMCRHESLACPAKGLELVVYDPSLVPAYELNLNSGARVSLHASTRAFEDEPHWFVIDLAVAREAACSLVGPDFADVFPELPAEDVRDAVREVLDWQQTVEPSTPNSVLSGCRALRFAVEGVWSSKSDAAAWARDVDPELVDAAVARRRSGASLPELDEARVRGLIERARKALS
jgi:hypothetical protein